FAFESSVRASLGRMSYLSKSKNTSTSSDTAAKSCTAGRTVVLGAGVAVPPLVVPPPPPPVLLRTSGEPPAGAAAVLLAAPLGAGAAACVVAGRLAHPLSATAATTRSEKASCEQRISMTPPFGVRWSVRVNRGKPITVGEATTRGLWPHRARA